MSTRSKHCRGWIFVDHLFLQPQNNLILSISSMYSKIVYCLKIAMTIRQTTQQGKKTWLVLGALESVGVVSTAVNSKPSVGSTALASANCWWAKSPTVGCCNESTGSDDTNNSWRAVMRAVKTSHKTHPSTAVSWPSLTGLRLDTCRRKVHSQNDLQLGFPATYWTKTYISYIRLACFYNILGWLNCRSFGFEVLAVLACNWML